VNVLDCQREMRLPGVADAAPPLPAERVQVLDQLQIVAGDAARLTGDDQLRHLQVRAGETNEAAGVLVALLLAMHTSEAEQFRVEAHRRVKVGDREAEMPDSNPPQALSACPVTYPPEDDKKNMTTSATSSGVCIRPSGTVATSRPMAARVVVPVSCARCCALRLVISVSTTPGQTALTVMPCDANASAAERTTLITPALLAA
jgi:hypothetical protein